MRYTTFMGFDPGGGLAVINEQGIKPWVLPDTRAGLVELLDFILPPGPDVRLEPTQVFAVVEQITIFQLYVKFRCQCGREHSKPFVNAGMSKLVKGAGEILGVLAGLNISHEEVAPRTWQSAFGLVAKRGERLTQTVKKNRHKDKAIKLWPGFPGRITHAVADAMLIAEFARMLKNGPKPLTKKEE